MRVIAHVISAVLQPLLMPSLVYFVALFHIDNSITGLASDWRWPILRIIFLTTCLIPVLTVLMLRFARVIKDIQMTNRKERFLPFLLISVFYLAITYLIHQKLPVTPLLSVIIITITAVVLLTNLITFFWKISAHCAAASGLIGFILGFSNIYATMSTLLFPMIVSVLLLGVIAWARLYLNAHHPREVLAGSVLGFFICFSSVNLFL